LLVGSLATVAPKDPWRDPPIESLRVFLYFGAPYLNAGTPSSFIKLS
jgi:hypothetical protein